MRASAAIVASGQAGERDQRGRRVATGMNILVRMPNWLGDAVMAVGFLNKLKDVYPRRLRACHCPG